MSEADTELQQLERERDDAQKALDDVRKELAAVSKELNDLQDQIDEAEKEIRKEEGIKRDDERELIEAKGTKHLRARVPGIMDNIRGRVNRLRELKRDIGGYIREIQAARRTQQKLERDEHSAERAFFYADKAVKTYRPKPKGGSGGGSGPDRSGSKPRSSSKSPGARSGGGKPPFRSQYHDGGKAAGLTYGGDRAYESPIHGTDAEGRDVTASFGRQGTPHEDDLLISEGHKTSDEFFQTEPELGHDHHGPAGEPGDKGDRGNYKN